MAAKNKIDIIIAIAVGSSMQIALFVVPVHVLLSYAPGNPMRYVYGSFALVRVRYGIS